MKKNKVKISLITVDENYQKAYSEKTAKFIEQTDKIDEMYYDKYNAFIDFMNAPHKPYDYKAYNVRMENSLGGK